VRIYINSFQCLNETLAVKPNKKCVSGTNLKIERNKVVKVGTKIQLFSLILKMKNLKAPSTKSCRVAVISTYDLVTLNTHFHFIRPNVKEADVVPG